MLFSILISSGLMLINILYPNIRFREAEYAMLEFIDNDNKIIETLLIKSQIQNVKIITIFDIKIINIFDIKIKATQIIFLTCLFNTINCSCPKQAPL